MQDKIVDEIEFEEMARRVVETNSMFTGAETGKSFHRKLSTKQLDALVNHKWPKSKSNKAGEVDPLKEVIRNIKLEDEDLDKNKGKKKADTKKMGMKDDGLENSRDARLKKLIFLGQNLRTSGQPRLPKLVEYQIKARHFDSVMLSLSWDESRC